MRRPCTITRIVPTPVSDEARMLALALLGVTSDEPGRMFVDVELTCARSEHHDRIHIDGSRYPVTSWTTA